jgi:TLC domain
MSTRRLPPSPFKAIQNIRKRRSRSAPPKLKKPLIEQHFRVEHNPQGRKEVLPGAIKHEDDWARDSHDFFNLIVLIPIVALNVMNWNWEILVNMKKKQTVADAWTGEWFDLFFWTTVLYFVADLCWIMAIPNSVKSPSVIIQHHVVTMVYILIPFYEPNVRWCMGACMGVEINTWFLIARRVFNKQGFPPWIIDLSFVSIRIKLISICFYVTWIGFRCIVYPMMMGYLFKRWWKESEHVGTYLNLEVIPMVLHAIFCVLNFKWTIDLIMSKVRYFRRRRRKGGVVAEKYSSGL